MLLILTLNRITLPALSSGFAATDRCAYSNGRSRLILAIRTSRPASIRCNTALAGAARY